MILFYCALRARQLPIKFDGSDRTNVIQQIDHNFPLSLTLLIIEMMSTMFKTKEDIDFRGLSCKENDIAGFFLPKHHSKMRDIEEAL